MTMRKYRSIIMILIVAMLVTAFTPVSFAASKKVKKMKSYLCIKSSNTVYCTNAHAIFKVNLKDKSVKSLTETTGGYLSDMRLKGKYLYYCELFQTADGSVLYRMNTKTGKKKVLARHIKQGYAISKNKIYYTALVKKNGKLKGKKKVMKLNGKGKKNTKWKAKMSTKETNKRGYHVWDDRDWEVPDSKTEYYLQTPSGAIFLEYADWVS